MNIYIIESGSCKLAVMSDSPVKAINKFWKHWGFPKGEKQQQQTVIKEVMLSLDII